MKLKVGDVVIIAKVRSNDDEDDDEDIWFLIKKREYHTIGRVTKIDLLEGLGVTVKVISSKREVEIGMKIDFRMNELITLNEAIKRGEMYEF